MDSKLTPQILPVIEGERPLWSVMIPCYNANPHYLGETLRSVLEQDPGRSTMQIELIDDGSATGAPSELVRKIAGDRVTVHQEEKNLGLAGIMNRCIERARGRWVHILHHDDSLLPGFYERLKMGADSLPAPGLIYCRHAFIDEQGRRSWLSNVDAPKPGLLNQALQHLAGSQMIQFPAVIVQRSVYETLGGFRSDLCYALDWEMWCRIARQYPVWYEPEVLACYRVHSATESFRLKMEGKDIKDVRKCIAIISDYLPDPKIAAQVRRFALKQTALRVIGNARSLLDKLQFTAAFRQVLDALMCDISFAVLKRALAFLLAAARQMAKATVLRSVK